ncbi:galanin receptor type 2-like [Mya arenaria]|uniref:galanin receptor type 2-like n=1 Tax=Mya arenaria TaxID=6604 RepID=UPI0022E607E2|nr:galanin receptor type 2-like [Mya arenaria]
MPDCDMHGFIECYVTYWIWRTVPIILLVVGTCGNILNITILLRRRLRKYSTSVYLMCLAVADLTFLWTSAFPATYYKLTGVILSHRLALLCKTQAWINHASVGVSMWLLVIMTIERLIMSRSLVIARTKITPRNAIKVSSVLIFICSAFPFYQIFHYEIRLVELPLADNSRVEVQRCTTVSDSFVYFQIYIWPFIVLFGLNIIPIVVIIIGNIGILISFIKQKKQLMKVNTVTSVDSAVSTVKLRRNRKPLAKMLIFVSSFCVVTTLPLMLYNCFWYTIDISTPRALERRFLVDTVLIQLVYCNYTFNFFLYFVSGTLFKREWNDFVGEILSKIFPRKRSHGTSGTAVAIATLVSEARSDFHNQTS